MIQKVKQEIIAEYKKNKVRTVFYVSALIIALLSFLKPSYTESIWGYIGITSINLAIVAGGIFLLWWFYLRKK